MDIQINKFSQDISNFVTLIKEYVSEFYKLGLLDINPEVFNIVEIMIVFYNKKNMITNFIEHSNIYWDNIKNRDKEFLSKGLLDIFYGSMIKDIKNLFGNESTQKIQESLEKFCNLFDSKDVFDNDKLNSIWTYLDTFLKTSVKYIHYSREPSLKKVDDTHVKRVWKNSSYKEIDIIKFCKHYNISLDWN